MDLLKPSYATGYAKNASQSAHPNLWDGLVGAWMPSLGVTGETLRDVSGNGNHGTLTNMDAATDWVATSKGLALDFDGSNDYATIGNVLNISGGISISSWVNLDVFPSGSGRSLIVSKGYDGTDEAYHLGFAGGSLLRFYTFNSTLGIRGVVYTHSFSVSRWYNIVGTFDESIWRLYIDGVNVINVTDPVALRVTSQPLIIGASSLSGSVSRFFNGSISNTSIYNRALSPTEIKQLYVDSLAPFRTKKRTVVRVPAAVPAATVVGSIKKPKTIIKPSYQAGYARNASESENPQLWDGLVSWVPSLGSSGSTVRCIQDKSRGIKNNGVTFSGSSEQSLSNGAFLSFDGSDDYMRIYDLSLKNVGYTNPDECLAVRFRRRSLTGTTALFGYLSASFLGAYGRGFYFDGTTMHCMSETNNNRAAITTTVDDNQWHVAIANFGANGSFYLDGKLIGTGSLNSSWSYWLQLASAAAHISPPANGANAAVDVSVAYQWNRLLTASEIKKISVDSLAPFRKKQRVSVAVPADIQFKPYWAKQSTQVSGLLK